MSTRSVIVRLEAEVAGYISGMGRAGRATDDVARQVVQSRRAVADNEKAMETAGKALMAFGTVSVAAMGASAKAAMDWESAWAGVTKTVDGSPEQMNELEASLRGLAKTLPATHEEIAGVAEAAGQLGVKREDIVAFTKTMVDLGETTNLTADEASTSIAQIANVMGTTGDDIDNFGATLVALGNAGASTEKEILEMTKRLAGAGKLIGATEGEVMAMANAMASVGIEAQLGGGVMSRVMQRMYADVKTGGEGLETLAKVAGMSSRDFAAAFESDPVRAIDAMIKGLAKVKDEGGNVVETMAELGIKGTEETGVILRLVGAGDLLGASLVLQEQAWRENTALITEASKRYETTESKVKIAWNGIKDAAIDAGAIMLPVIQGIAENVSGLSSMFGDLPAPVQGALTAMGGIVGTAALLGGGLLTLLPKINETRTAFRDLNASGSRVPGMLGKIGKAAGAAAAVVIAFEVVKGIANSMQPATQSVERFTQALVGLRTDGGSIDQSFRDIDFGPGIKGLDSAGEALDRLINQDIHSGLTSFSSTVLGVDNSFTKMADAVSKVDQSIAAAASSGNTTQAAAGFKAVAESAKEQGVEIEETAKRFPLYLDSLRALATESGVNVTETELLAWAMGEIPPAMEAAAAGGDKAAQALLDQGGAAAVAAAQNEAVIEALKEVGLSADGAVSDIQAFTAVLFAAGLLSLSASDAAIAYQGAIDAMTDSVKTNGKSLDINTEKGRANQTAYNGIAKAAMTAMTATAEETLATKGSAAAQEQLQVGLKQSYTDLIAAAGQLGITGTAADEMARKALGIPNEVPIDTWVNDKATATLEGIKGKADALDGRVIRTYSIHKETTVHETTGSASVQTGAGTADKRTAAHADGGAIRGAGTSTSDEVPIWASDGEHMLDKGDVQKMGGQQAVYRFREQLKSGQLQLAGGGAVGTSTPARALMSQHTSTPSVSLEGLTVLVTNPFTGKQVEGIVAGVAQQQARGVVSEADNASRYIRPGRRS